MSRRLVATAALRFTATHAVALPLGGLGRAAFELDDVESLVALEATLHEPDTDAAFRRYAVASTAPLPLEVRAALALAEPGTLDADDALILLHGGSLTVCPRADSPLVLDFSDLSRDSGMVLRALAEQRGWAPRGGGGAGPEGFRRCQERLAELGLLAPAIGHLRWGDWRRQFPFCPSFGLGRGTPVDRYYLERFIAESRQQVRGDVVELGGRAANRQAYGFDCDRYRGVDLQAGDGVEVVGDIHDASLFAEASLDTVLAFNVLEHCRQPWVVAENTHRWLRGGGRVLCMVPNAQRLHEMPEDYWRPLPAAVDSLFSMFPVRRMRVYGNPVATIASLFGVAAEELTAEELAVHHPSYPVASCIVAEKA
jgi:SAM-dependent methyltransferase